MKTMSILGTDKIATPENKPEWVLGTPLARSVGTLAGTRVPKFGMDTAHR